MKCVRDGRQSWDRRGDGMLTTKLAVQPARAKQEGRGRWNAHHQTGVAACKNKARGEREMECSPPNWRCSLQEQSRRRGRWNGHHQTSVAARKSKGRGKEGDGMLTTTLALQLANALMFLMSSRAPCALWSPSM